MSIPARKKIEGKYEILAKLSEGGMGAVYKVRHRLLEEIRVIKVVLPQFQQDPDLEQRFLREARSAVKLRHPNIAQVHDFSIDDDNTAFMVMEFIEGHNLAELLAYTGPLKIGTVLEVGIQTLRALSYLHRNDFVHRDVSPDNLILSHDVEGRTQIKLIDLGIAKPLAETGKLTKEGLFLGKLRYSSPEQLGGVDGKAKIDQRSDLYALGVVLYELVTGSLPIAGEDYRSLLAGHLMHPPRSFDETDPGHRVPDELRVVILKALEKEVDNRFADADEFSRSLEAIRDVWVEPEAPEGEPQPTVVLPKRIEPRVKPGSTQERLDRQFDLEPTPQPGLNREDTEIDPTVRIDKDSTPATGKLPAIEALEVDDARHSQETVVTESPTTPKPDVIPRTAPAAAQSGDRAPKAAERSRPRPGKARWVVGALGLLLIAAALGYVLFRSAASRSVPTASRVENTPDDPPVDTESQIPREPAETEESGRALSTTASNTQDGSESESVSGTTAGGDSTSPATVSNRTRSNVVTEESMQAPAKATPRDSEKSRAVPSPARSSVVDPSKPQAEQLTEKARALRDGGDRSQALATAARALELDPSSKQATNLVSQLLRQSREEMLEARRDAQAAGISSQSSTDYSQASARMRLADAKVNNQEWVEAVSLYDSSTELFRSALTSAASESAAVAESVATPPKTTEQSPRPAAPEPAPAPPPTQVPQAPPAGGKPEDAITATLARFASAYEHLDVSALQAIWPSLKGNRLETIRRTLDNAESIDVDLKGCWISLSETSATAKCKMVQLIQPKVGPEQSVKNQVVFKLKMTDGYWIISSFR